MFNKVSRVFISATSRDLGSFRKAVSEILVTLNALPVVQDHFGPDYRSVVEMLREKIGQCDAAICLVGRCYGREPHERASDRPRRSYTQLEYETAVELGKPVFVFVADRRLPARRAVGRARGAARAATGAHQADRRHRPHPDAVPLARRT